MRSPGHPSAKRPRRHSQLHLPPLDAQQALLLVHVLERAIQAIYRAHGYAMVQLSAAQIDPPAHRTLRSSRILTDDDFPF